MELGNGRWKVVGRKATSVFMSAVLVAGLNPVAKMPQAYAAAGGGGVQVASVADVKAQAVGAGQAQLITSEQKVGDTYLSLGAAVQAAFADPGSTVRLLEDSTEPASGLSFTEANAQVTIDLMGKTLTLTGEEAFKLGGGKVSVINGTVATSVAGAFEVAGDGAVLTLGADLVVNATGSVVNAKDKAKVTIDGASIETSGEQTAVSGKSGAAIEMASGTVAAKGGAAISADAGSIVVGQAAGKETLVKSEGASALVASGNDASIAVSGGKVVGAASGVSSSNGAAATITGGDISGTTDGAYVGGTAESQAGHDGTLVISGGTVSGGTHGVYVYGGSATISDGMVSGPLAVEEEPASGTATISVSGGLFTDASAWPFKDSGKAVVLNESEETAEQYPYTVAADSNVASALSSSVGTVGYESVADAFDAAKTATGELTVSLYKDAAEDVAVPEDMIAKLDLAGHKLANVAADTVTVPVTSELTIVDSSESNTTPGTGEIDNATNGKAALLNNGKVTVEAGKLLRSAEVGTDKETSGDNSFSTVLNHGTMTVKGGTFENKGHYSNVLANGYSTYDGEDARASYVKDTNKAAPELVIEGGSFEGGLNAIENGDGATVTVKGGDFKGFTQHAVMNGNVAAIGGGTFTQDSSANDAVLANIASAGDFNAGNLTVTGGTFTAGTANGALLYTGGDLQEAAEGKGAIAVSGGAFKGVLPESLAASHALSISGGKFSAKDNLSGYVAQGFAVQENKGTDSADYGWSVEAFDASIIDVDIVDHGEDGTLSDDKKPADYKVSGKRVDGTTNVAVDVSGTGLVKHYSFASADKLDYWAGFGIPFAGADYSVALNYGEEDPSAWKWQALGEPDYTVGEGDAAVGYTSIYFRNAKAKAEGFSVSVKDKDGRIVASYTVDSSKLLNKSDLTYTEAKGGTVSGVESAVEGGEVELKVEADDGFKLKKITYQAEGAAEVEITEAKSFEMPSTDVTVKAEFEEFVAGAAVAAPLNDHGAEGTTPNPNTDMRPAGYTLSQETNGHVASVTLKADAGASIVAHYNAQHAKAHWVGIGVPYTTGQVVEIGLGAYSDDAKASGTDPSTGVDFTVGEDSAAVGYASAYWDNAKLKGKGGWLRVTDGGVVVAVYNISSELKDSYDIAKADVENGTLNVVATSVEDANVTVTASPDHGYYLDSLTYKTADGDPVDIDNGAFKMPSADVTVEAVFRAIQFENAKVAVTGGTSFEYTGSRIEPAVTSVELGSDTLVADKDYKVAYPEDASANIAVGKGTVTVTGIGAYEGTGAKTVEFEITPKPVADGMIEAIDAQVFTGDAIEPELTVTDGGKKLAAGTDYAVAYSGNTEVGSAATATVVGFGNYGGTAAKTFTISKANVKDATIAHIDAQEYTGEALKPALSVTSKAGKALSEGTDYVAAYASNVDAGEAKVTIVGMGNYEGTQTATFVITAEPKSLADHAIDAIPAQAWTGAAVKPAVTIEGLVEGKDFTVSYSDNVERGTATATATGAGDYTGTLEATFEIYGDVTADLSQATVEVADAPYTGKAVEPQVTVTAEDGTVLAEGTEYAVEVEGDAVAIGQYKFTVKPAGVSTVTGSKAGAFNVVKADLASNVTISVGNAPYTGEAVEPELSAVNTAGEELAAGIDYIALFADNTAVGEASVVLVGQGNYTGSATATFRILGTTLGAAGVAASVGEQPWTGKAVEPELNLKNSAGVALAKGTDYLAKFSGNTEVGTAKATVVGWGAYSGTMDVEFQIMKAQAEIGVGIDSWTYGQDASEPKVTGAPAEGPVAVWYKAKGAADDAYTTVQPTDAGEYAVKAEYAESEHYKAAAATSEFSILKAQISPVVSIEGWTYGETAKAPSVEGNPGGGEVAYAYKAKGADDSTYSAEAPTDAGDYTVRATVPATANYLGGAATADFAIAKAASKVTVADKKATFNGKAVASSKATVAGSTGKVTYVYYSDAKCTKSVSATGVKNAGIYYVKAAVAADANHEAATSAPAKITIAQAANKVTAKSTSVKKSFNANKKTKKLAKAQTVALPKVTATSGTAKWSVSSKDKKGVLALNAKTGKVTVKKGAKKGTYTIVLKASVAASANYKAATSKPVTVKVTVK